MVVFVDLEEGDADASAHAQFHPLGHSAPASALGNGTGHDSNPGHAPAPAPFQNAATEAFCCYPIVMEIAADIDLNTLDSLARTSRQIRHGLLQYRSRLIVSTLHCSNEDVPVDPESTFRYRARAGNWYYMEDGRSYNGKSGSCARDMVAECRRCGTVVCRNCAIKPPAPIAMGERHRRLCLTCAKAPIAELSKSVMDPKTPLSSDAMQREICQCANTGVWLCQPCGRSIRASDHDYQRIWKWRNQYGEVGTGIGEGDRGVICGRETACAGAKEREQETDCDAEDARDTYSTTDGLLDIDYGARYARTPSPSQLGPGYERHEIEGIGGVVKTKLVRMVRVGGCVPEWADERNKKQVLQREVSGQVRSWCGWCWRVIPGEADIKQANEADGKK